MVVSILLYGCTTRTLTKRIEKKLDGKCTRMLRAIFTKSWRQHPTKPQLYGHLPPITKTINVRRTRHAGHCWRSRDELIGDVLQWTRHIAEQKQDDQLEPTCGSSVGIRDVAMSTCQKRWTIGRSGERESVISVLAACHDDDDDDDTRIEYTVFLWILIAAPTKLQLYCHWPYISQTLLVRRRRHGGYWKKSKDEIMNEDLLLAPKQKHIRVGWPTKIYFHHFYGDTRCCLENV